MQYWQRRLHRSVTEMRRLRSGLARRSTIAEAAMGSAHYRIRRWGSREIRADSDAQLALEAAQRGEQHFGMLPRRDHADGAEDRRFGFDDRVGLQDRDDRAHR